MIALVTGSSGFIGSHVVERLLAQGAEVRCLARPESAAPAWTSAQDPRVQRATVDLRDARALARTRLLDDVDVVVHAAGVTRGRSDADFERGNVAPLAALLGAMRERGSRPRVVLVSSQAAAGPARALEEPVTEAHEPRPVEAYGESKLRAERLLRAQASVPWTIVRPASVYGPRDADFLELFRAAARGVMVYPGTRDGHLSIVHVRDCVSGIVAAAGAPAAEGRTLFLADREPVSWRDVYRAVAGAVRADGSRPIELAVPGWLLRAAAPIAERLWWSSRPPLLTRQKARLAAPRFWVCSPALAERLLPEWGAAARTTLPGGMRETYLWYLENGWLRRRRASADLLRPVA